MLRVVLLFFMMVAVVDDDDLKREGDVGISAFFHATKGMLRRGTNRYKYLRCTKTSAGVSFAHFLRGKREAFHISTFRIYNTYDKILEREETTYTVRRTFLWSVAHANYNRQIMNGVGHSILKWRDGVVVYT